MAAVLEDVRRDLSKDVNEANVALATATTALGKIIARAREVERAEILPKQFIGIVHGYRFGINGEGPKGRKMPTHRFEVEVPDTGLWLHVCVGSDRFDTFVATADPPIEEMTADQINGKMVTVERDAEYGRTVPVCFGIPVDPEAPVLFADDNGIELRRGDRVRIKENTDSKAADATILRKDNRYLIYQRADRKGESSFNTGREGTIRPRKLNKIGVNAEKTLLGVDRLGNSLFTGDRVKDLYESGNPTCILVGKDEGGTGSYAYAGYRESFGENDSGGATFNGRKYWGLRKDYTERID